MEFDNNKLDYRNSRMQKMRAAFDQGNSPYLESVNDAYRYGRDIARRYSELNKDQTTWNRMSFWEKLKPSSWWYAGDEYTGFDIDEFKNASKLFEERLTAANLTEDQKNKYRRAFKIGFNFQDQDAHQYNESEKDATEYLMQQASEAGTAVINPLVRIGSGGAANTYAEAVLSDGDFSNVTTSGDILKRYARVRGAREATKLGLKGEGLYGAVYTLANAWTYPLGTGMYSTGEAVNHLGRTIQNINDVQQEPNKWIGYTGKAVETIGSFMALKGGLSKLVGAFPATWQGTIDKATWLVPTAYYTAKNLWGAGYLATVNNVDVLSGPANAGDRDAEFDKYVTENMQNINLDDPEVRAKAVTTLGVSPDTDQYTLKKLLQQDMERSFGRTRADDVLANAVVQFSTTSVKNKKGEDGEIRADKQTVLDTMTKLRSSGMSRDDMVDNMLGQLDAWHRQHNQSITPEALDEIKTEFLEEYYEATRREVSRGNYVDPDIFLSRHFTDAQAKTLIKTHVQAEHARLSSNNDFVDLVRQGMSYLGGEKTTTWLVTSTMRRSDALQDSMSAYVERVMGTEMGLRESTDKEDDSLSESLGVDVNSVWRALGSKRREKITNNVVASATGADIVRLVCNPDIKGKTGELGTIANDVAAAVARRCNRDGEFAGELGMASMSKLKEMGGEQSNEQLTTFLSVLDPDAIANNMPLKELKKLAPVIAQLASEGADDSELPEELKKLKDGMTVALQTRLKNEMTKNPFEVMPVATSLYLASKGHPKLAEFFSDPFKFYGTALLVLIGGSWLLSELFSEDDEDDDRSTDKQKDLMEELLRQRGLQAHDNGANYELNL